MINWDAAYNRLKVTKEFSAYYSGGHGVPAKSAFRALTYSTIFTGVAAVATPVTQFGDPQQQLQQFPAGAVILQISACAYQEQTDTGAFTYAPHSDKSRRDLFGIGFSYTNDELITVGGLNGVHLASALLGTGEDSKFPQKELLIPPSQSIQITVASITVAPTLVIGVDFHAMVPRAVG